MGACLGGWCKRAETNTSKGLLTTGVMDGNGEGCTSDGDKGKCTLMSSNNTGLGRNLGAMSRADWKPRRTILVRCWRHACCKLCCSARLAFLVFWYCCETRSRSSNNSLASLICLRCDTRSSTALVICCSLEGWYIMG